MKVLIFNPYFDTLGGGERYTLYVANYFLQKKALVEIAWKEKNLTKLAKSRFNIKIDRVKIIPKYYEVFRKKNNLFKKYKITSQFDIIFFVSDGSIPFLFGKRNLLHFQVPFKNIKGRSWFNQLKLKFIHKVICNSLFTKKVIDREFKLNSQVLYPPLLEELRPAKKENIILSVGRFDSQLNSKKQDVLVKVFKKLISQKKLTNWKLILAGSLLSNEKPVQKLKSQSRGFPVIIKTNIDFVAIQKLYSKAKIYWHAAGFGENLVKHPERAEHFGISVLEAMVSECLPIVFNGGGLPEIVEDGRSGFLFQTLSQLEGLTLKVIKDQNLFKEISQKAQTRVKDFSKEHFFQKLDEIIK